MAKRKRKAAEDVVETTEQATEEAGEETVDPTPEPEPSPKAPEITVVPEPAPTRPASRERNPVVILRYAGQDPIAALADVPSKAKYRINTNGLVSVYRTDVETLLTRKGFSRA